MKKLDRFMEDIEILDIETFEDTKDIEGCRLQYNNKK